MKTLGRYQITYGCGVTQQKDLIEHDDYVNIIKPTRVEIMELDMKTPQSNNIKKKIKKLKNELLETFGDNWFTNQSPIYGALDTGILSLPNAQGGDHRCELKLL